MSARPSKNVQGNWRTRRDGLEDTFKLWLQQINSQTDSRGLLHLVDEGPERREDLLESSLRLGDLQEAQMDLEDLLHQGVVTQI